VFRDAIATIRRAFQCSHCKRMAKGVRRRSRQPCSVREANPGSDSLECAVDVVDKQGLSAQRDEDVIIERGIGAPYLEIVRQARSSRIVQWHDTAPMELGTSNNKAVLCNVIESQTNGFRHSKTRAGEQREQRAASPSYWGRAERRQ
jgi:hypothetical protein